VTPKSCIVPRIGSQLTPINIAITTGTYSDIMTVMGSSNDDHALRIDWALADSRLPVIKAAVAKGSICATIIPKIKPNALCKTSVITQPITNAFKNTPTVIALRISPTCERASLIEIPKVLLYRPAANKMATVNKYHWSLCTPEKLKMAASARPAKMKTYKYMALVFWNVVIIVHCRLRYQP
jgi:hypothetical protein